MSVNISTKSRLRFSNLSVIDGVEFWDTLMLPDSFPRSDDIQHVVLAGERIDLIANRYYQDSGMWWIIAWANDLELIPADLKENMNLRIPSLDFITNTLIRRNRRVA